MSLLIDMLSKHAVHGLCLSVIDNFMILQIGLM